MTIGFGFDYYNMSVPVCGIVSLSDEAFGREIEFESTPVQVTARDLILEAGNFNATIQNSEVGSIETASQGSHQATVDSLGHPQGHGFSRMRVSKRGTTIVRGKTGDHRPFSSGSTLRKDRKVQVKARVGTARSGSLLGLVGINAAQAKASGELRWLIPGRSASAGAYLAGFDLKMNADAKKLSESTGKEGILLFPEGSDKLVKVSVGNHRGELLAAATMPLVSGTLDNGPGKSFRLRVSVNQKSGVFKGSLFLQGKKTPISGIIRPGERNGLGVAGETGFDGPVELKAL